MRDLQDIAEINGPRRAELQAERAKTVLIDSIISETLRPAAVLRQQHGDRVAARHAQNS